MLIHCVLLGLAASGPYGGNPPLPGALDAPAPTGPGAACEAAALLGLGLGCEGGNEAGGDVRAAPAERLAAIAAIVRGGFEVDAFISDIQAESAALQDLEALSQSVRDRRVAVLSAGAGVLGVGAAVGTAMTLQSRTTTAGIWVSTVAGAVGGLLSIYAAVASPGARTPIHLGPSMLGPLLARGGSRTYPPLIDAYLDRPPSPGGPTARRDVLLAAWSRLGLLGPGGVDPGQLTTPIRPGQTLDADVVATRGMMLGDLRGVMAGLKRDLGALAEVVVRETTR
jgi:hypothetical protein